MSAMAARFDGVQADAAESKSSTLLPAIGTIGVITYQ